MKSKLFVIFAFVFSLSANAQTSGTLSFSVTTKSAGGNYSPRHLLAIWIENTGGTFIKTKIKYGNSYLQYLNVWKSKSGSNVVDATTGQTLQSHGTRTFTWNATNVSGALVPDGDYKIWIQMTDKNANGATANVTFTKGPNAISNQTFADQGNYTQTSLSWTPSTGIIENTSDFDFTVYPNPFNNETFIKFENKTNDNPEIEIYDIKGSAVKTINYNNIQTENTVIWDGTNQLNKKVSEGLYIVKIKIGENTSYKKILKR